MHRLVSVSVSLIAGCTQYVRVHPVEIHAISVTTADYRDGFCVGGDAPQLKVKLIFDDGTQLDAWGASHEDSELTDGQQVKLQWTSSTGRVDNHGRFIAPADPLTAIGKPVQVHVAVRDRPSVADDIWLAPRYDCGTLIDLSADAAPSGNDGLDGEPGTTTSGRDGGDGSDGRNGDAAEDGPMVDVSLGLISSATSPLAIARVTPVLGTPRYALFATDHGWLSIGARGGAGGHGGRGGRGGDGAPGRDGGVSARSGRLHLPKPPGRDGNDGRDGHDGAGGRGGTVTVHYDAAHPELLQLVEADTRGGSGLPDGSDGPPMRTLPDQASVLFAKELTRGLPIVINELP